MAEILASIPLKHGRNNRVFHLILAEGERTWEKFCGSAQRFGHMLTPPHSQPFPKNDTTLVLKSYFQHPEDRRPRLQSEFSFLSYAWENEIHCIPQPLACNENEHWALYSFIAGRPPEIADVNKEAVEQALSFFLALNDHKKAALHLPYASEACLSVLDFFESVEKRMIKLLAIENEAVRTFAQELLLPKWTQIKHRFRSIDATSLKPHELCISPSDFGFHNAIVHQNTYFFLDFEYAGWDDPVKTACDFFCQPKVRVPLNYFDQICQQIAAITPHPMQCMEKIHLLFPVCQIKWCCIMLNGFLGTGQARRSFAQFEEIEQLEKTREYLCHI